jgi:hypothetical protein
MTDCRSVWSLIGTVTSPQQAPKSPSAGTARTKSTALAEQYRGRNEPMLVPGESTQSTGRVRSNSLIVDLPLDRLLLKRYEQRFLWRFGSICRSDGHYRGRTFDPPARSQ